MADAILVRPGPEHLPAYRAALERGFAPDTLRPASAREEMDWIDADPAAFLAACEDRVGRGRVTLPDGSTVPLLPTLRRFLRDGDFAGWIGLRWQPGAEALPPTCSGHVGYAVVPWRRGEGLATRALAALLPEARTTGLRHLEITADVANAAARRVIEKAGGIRHPDRTHPPELGGGRIAVYRIALA
ncbi:MAG: GNAT family N-acetyltransferase [Shimia sp.]